MDTLFLRTALHFTTLHSTSLHFSTLHFFPFKLHPSTLNFTHLHRILPIYTETVPLYIHIYICYITPCNLIRMNQLFGVTFLLLIICINLFTLTSRIKPTVCTQILMPLKTHIVIFKTNPNQDRV